MKRIKSLILNLLKSLIKPKVPRFSNSFPTIQPPRKKERHMNQFLPYNAATKKIKRWQTLPYNTQKQRHMKTIPSIFFFSFHIFHFLPDYLIPSRLFVSFQINWFLPYPWENKMQINWGTLTSAQLESLQPSDFSSITAAQLGSIPLSSLPH
jgi:hypothetical protein